VSVSSTSGERAAGARAGADHAAFDVAAYAAGVTPNETERAVVIANLSKFPARVKCRGLFFQGVATLVADALGPDSVGPLFARAAVAERSVPFKLYAHVDFYKLYYLASSAIEPDVALPVAMRRTARKFFPIFRESVVGKTMSALMGQLPATILPLLAKAYNVSIENNSHHVQLDGANRAIWEAETEPVEWYGETFFGIIEGAMPPGQSVEVRLENRRALGALHRHEFSIRW